MKEMQMITLDFENLTPFEVAALVILVNKLYACVLKDQHSDQSFPLVGKLGETISQDHDLRVRSCFGIGESEGDQGTEVNIESI